MLQRLTCDYKNMDKSNIEYLLHAQISLKFHDSFAYDV